MNDLRVLKNVVPLFLSPYVMRPLDWLGGDEQDVAKTTLMKVLLGTWIDQRGSLYELTQQNSTRITVVTLRRNGKVISTRGLIRIEVHASSAGAIWSSKFQLIRHHCGIEWRGAKGSFFWTKLQ